MKASKYLNRIKNFETTLSAIKRAATIQDIASEKQYLEEVIYRALMDRGPLKYPQRMEVLSNIVDRIRKESQERKTEAGKKMLEEEYSNDVAKRINILNIF